MKTTSRLEAALRSNGELGLIPYAMGGYPDLHRSQQIAIDLARSGAVAIEIGIPFNDPLADGPVIQAAGQAALESGATMAGCLELAGVVAKESPVPVVLMTYGNPILAYGRERFADQLAQLGVAGVIVADLPADEAELMRPLFRDAGVDQVFLVAPTSSDDRIRRVCEVSSGFVYCVTLAGVTGARKALPRDLSAFLQRVRRHTDLPLVAGFGVSKPEHLRSLRGVADAAIVASALVAEVQAGRDPSVLAQHLAEACRR